MRIVVHIQQNALQTPNFRGSGSCNFFLNYLMYRYIHKIIIYTNLISLFVRMLEYSQSMINAP